MRESWFEIWVCVLGREKSRCGGFEVGICLMGFGILRRLAWDERCRVIGVGI